MSQLIAADRIPQCLNEEGASGDGKGVLDKDCVAGTVVFSQSPTDEAYDARLPTPYLADTVAPW